MIGLKTYLPALASHLATTADALYERQRKLVKSGVMVGSTGRGPGSGVRVSPNTVSLMIIAMMATDELTDLENSVQKLALQKSDSSRCPLTGASNFGDALAFIISNEALASSVISISVVRSQRFAEVTFQKRGSSRYDGSSFGRPKASIRVPTRYHLEIEAKLPRQSIVAIAREFTVLAAGKSLNRAGEENAER